MGTNSVSVKLLSFLLEKFSLKFYTARTRHLINNIISQAKQLLQNLIRLCPQS